MMQKTYLALARTVFLTILCGVGISACTQDMNWKIQDAINNIDREKIETLGTPSRGYILGRTHVTHEYIVGMPDHVIRLGEEFTQVRSVIQFSGGDSEYAVLECTRADGSKTFLLLNMPSSYGAAWTTTLNGAVSNPFKVTMVANSTALSQQTDVPDQIQFWVITPAGVRGPAVFSLSQMLAAQRNAAPQTQTPHAAAKSRRHVKSAKAAPAGPSLSDFPAPANPTAATSVEQTGKPQRSSPKPAQSGAVQPAPANTILDSPPASQ